MTKKIFITREIPELGINMLKDKGYEVDINISDTPPTQKEIINFLQKKPYDAVVTLLTDKIDANVFESAPGVKIYANYATGFDNIDVVEATKRDITVTNAPAPFSSEAVAEHTISIILALTTRIVEANEFTKKGNYKGWSPMIFIGSTIVGKTVGIVGAGSIGEKTAFYANGLCMKVIYTDVKRNDKIEKEFGAVFYEKLDELLPLADYVSLNVPLLESTKHLINSDRLKLMKNTAFLINTSRGAVVDELALTKALENKTIAGAGLDVFEFEPEITHGLKELSNVILTPHISSASMGARNQMAERVAQNIIDFFEGKAPDNKITV